MSDFHVSSVRCYATHQLSNWRCAGACVIADNIRDISKCVSQKLFCSIDNNITDKRDEMDEEFCIEGWHIERLLAEYIFMKNSI